MGSFIGDYLRWDPWSGYVHKLVGAEQDQAVVHQGLSRLVGMIFQVTGSILEILFRGDTPVSSQVNLVDSRRERFFQPGTNRR